MTKLGRDESAVRSASVPLQVSRMSKQLALRKFFTRDNVNLVQVERSKQSGPTESFENELVQQQILQSSPLPHIQ